MSYGAIAARELHADFADIAWSGRKMWPNNTIPSIYNLTLPNDTASTWAFGGPGPDALLINLATNDFGPGIPDERNWTGAYSQFIDELRSHYPSARIYLAAGPMMSDAWPPESHTMTVLLPIPEGNRRRPRRHGRQKLRRPQLRHPRRRQRRPRLRLPPQHQNPRKDGREASGHASWTPFTGSGGPCSAAAANSVSRPTFWKTQDKPAAKASMRGYKQFVTRRNMAEAAVRGPPLRLVGRLTCDMAEAADRGPPLQSRSLIGQRFGRRTSRVRKEGPVNLPSMISTFRFSSSTEAVTWCGKPLMLKLPLARRCACRRRRRVCPRRASSASSR